VEERTTNQCTVGGLAAALVADGPIITAPPVSAGTWQRRMTHSDGFTSHTSCAQMSVGQLSN
jgi:hypothetical protein